MALAVLVFIGLFISRVAFCLLLTLFMFLDAAVVAGFYFQMPVTMVLDATQFVSALKVQDSEFYAILVIALFACLIATVVVVGRAKARRHELSLYPFVLTVSIMLGLDIWANLSPQELEKFKNVSIEPFTPLEDAASSHSKLNATIGSSRQTNVLIVMVEGLGAFKKSNHQELIWGPLLNSEIAEKFTVTGGASPYLGSTTTAEVRELCQKYGDYRHFRDVEELDCLPKQAESAGYKTAAFHGFSGDFFERYDWYPKIGFRELNFTENRAGLADTYSLSLCGRSFRGMCDADVAFSVKSHLLSGGKQPKFTYWLTLNSHTPVGYGEVPERLNCTDGGVFGDNELCRISEQWLNISHLVSEIATDPDLPQTEILLVGDHHPPLFTRHGRSHFERGRVAWLHLTPKSIEAGPMPKRKLGTQTARR